MFVTDRVERLRTAVQGVLDQVNQRPLDVLYRAPGSAEWSVMSTLAHLEELMPYWAHQAEAIVAHPGKPFGRTHDDPDRIAAVDQHGHDRLDEIAPRIRASLEECVRVLEGLPPDAPDVAGVHPRRGSMTVAEMVDAFLVRHVEEHAAQVNETLAALGTGR